ncbi:MAG: glutamyl-tRNA reductase [Bacteroidia bacterium]
MYSFKIIALSHKNLELDEVGKLHLDEGQQESILGALKINFGFEELMYLSTCNRVEFILKTDLELSKEFLTRFFSFYNPSFNINFVERLSTNALVFESEAALDHLFKVASSIDSLVVGEREIITQVRKAYENCNLLGLTGDTIRLAIKQTIETAKDIYTHTDIAKNPVSVVSLAYRKLRELGIKNEARFIIIGSGETNSTMAKYLQKHQFANFAVFNRTLSKAEELAGELGGKAFELNELKNYAKGFDVIVSCTGASEPVITKEIYTSLIAGDTSRKVVIDLAIPNDMDADILNHYDVNLIAVNNLRDIAKENLAQREGELYKCQDIIETKIEEFKVLLKERRIEIAFSEIPRQVKAIKETAMNEVFAKDISALDAQGREVLDKVLSYMEKKYNAVTMKTAKQLFLEE